ncbi:COX15-CtaA-domain-containing protein [Tilletiaria anomala UBC 951]|uniref:COX15-CtaA-domain-containing protein n=1 Tax=Tilletiaria anomala (strain ATCC 24038 / CBS 436.72 / UBC 951) TaxID=1037660 RepID=A0A066VD84_TILAU|nr:COX15-CtaA-domain-containing protein [Tilletiaria anomala UBC 951]KDN36555.1 COX15-CtaA-domain-containing protein [Tilletiaria anomala UBC 951]
MSEGACFLTCRSLTAGGLFVCGSMNATSSLLLRAAPCLTGTNVVHPAPAALLLLPRRSVCWSYKLPTRCLVPSLSPPPAAASPCGRCYSQVRRFECSPSPSGTRALHRDSHSLQALFRRALATTVASPIAKAADSGDVAEAPRLSGHGSDGQQDSSHSTITHPHVAYHLFAVACLVYAIVIVGGLTRLTESGLSITEWNPGFKGMWLPSSPEEWEHEWSKYRQTPEFLLLNKSMTLDDFKSIYMWEWAHRVLGRVIGVAFVLPAAFFLTRRWVAKDTRWKLLAIAGGIGFQGFLGWYMVTSGLAPPPGSAPVISTADTHITTALPPQSPADWTPRVSQFRLAAHLGTAFLVYAGMVHTGLLVLRDYRFTVQKGTVGGFNMAVQGAAEKYIAALQHPLFRRHARITAAVTLLSFITILSGAMVAGLDAGLVYNEFPAMGEGRLAPPFTELMDDRYSQRPDKGDKVWRNLTQNPVTVQLIHRTLAITTLCSVIAFGWRTRNLRAAFQRATAGQIQLPPVIPRLAMLASACAIGQATLGIMTLIYLVPIPLASAHQGGSLIVLTVLVSLLAAMKKPSQAMQLWRQQQQLGRGAKSLCDTI